MSPVPDLASAIGARVQIDRGPAFAGPERYVAGRLAEARYVDGATRSGWVARLFIRGHGDRWIELPDGTSFTATRLVPFAGEDQEVPVPVR